MKTKCIILVSIMNFEDYETLPTQNSITHMTAGAIAGVMEHCVMYPLDSVKTRMQSLRSAHNGIVKQRLQMLNSPYRGVWECARHVYRAEGARAFYRSYGTQVAMNVPFQAVHFVTYEWWQSRLNPTRTYNPSAHLTAGACAGALAAASTTPLDVCKTVLNTQEQRGAEGLSAAASMILRTYGPRGFFRGVTARVLYQMPAAAICWLTYETLKHALTVVSL
ncbi:unnamed protein product [Leptidea sinapis]|uniref:Mitoferrin n=1 Tax=Leptidea sinapis TaxID=189913 RepID=A0A5E4QPF4_9NEOP|nr:unnamed protein product [Leptidea sinapis]